MRLVIAAALLAGLLGEAVAQVPGTVGPPPDSRLSPGAEGPTFACRLFDFGCKPAPEPALAPPAAAEEDAALEPKRESKPKRKAKREPKPKAAAETETVPAPAAR